MDNIRKQENKHDFFGSLSPKMEPQLHGYGACKTFSVGIFRWLPKASSKGLKKSAVKYRVRGYTSNPEPVYRRAGEICDELDAMYEKDPLWRGPHKKSETVRSGHLYYDGVEILRTTPHGIERILKETHGYPYREDK